MDAPTGILETVIYARDIDAAERFYTEVFGLEVVQKVPERLVFLRCGRQMLLVFDPEQSRQNDPQIGIPRHGTEGAGHVCFRAQDRAEVDAWRAHFGALGVPVEHVHIWADGSASVYVRDPAGNSVEVAEARLWGLA